MLTEETKAKIKKLATETISPDMEKYRLSQIASFDSFSDENEVLEEYQRYKSPTLFSLKPKRLKRIGLANMSPRQFLINRFDMERKNIICICGSSNAGKTLLAQYLALCVAAKHSIFGAFAINDNAKGKVLHIDYEQSEDQTQRRYERLANGLGIEIGEIDRIKPPYKLDDPLFTEQTLTDMAAGYDMVIVDSLRQSMACDENSSQVSVVLELLKRIAENCNTCIVLIHHKGKHSDPNAKDNGRGSSAIYAGVDVQIDLDADDKGIITLKCTKNRDQAFFNSLTYSLVDCGGEVESQRCTEGLDLLLLNGCVPRQSRELAILQMLTNGQFAKQTLIYERTGKGDRDKFVKLLEDMNQQQLIAFEKKGTSVVWSMGINGQSHLDNHELNGANNEN